MYATTEGPQDYAEGETVFGWDWGEIFWFTTISVVVGTTLKVIKAGAFETERAGSVPWRRTFETERVV